MQDLELKASKQAKRVHVELSVEVIKMKTAHAEQEAQHAEAVKVFLAKIEELEQQKKALQEREQKPPRLNPPPKRTRMRSTRS